MTTDTKRPSFVRRAKRAAKVTLRMATKRRTTRARIVSDLRALGVRRGGILLVHSSLSALGYVSGGSAAVSSAPARDASESEEGW